MKTLKNVDMDNQKEQPQENLLKSETGYSIFRRALLLFAWTNNISEAWFGYWLPYPELEENGCDIFNHHDLARYWGLNFDSLSATKKCLKLSEWRKDYALPLV